MLKTGTLFQQSQTKARGLSDAPRTHAALCAASEEETMDPNIEDILKFRKMITPVIIQVVFWILVAIVVISGLFSLGDNFLYGLLMIILGPIVVRIYAEILIVLFKMNDWLAEINQTLTEIKNQRS
jgi:hypothetical protein